MMNSNCCNAPIIENTDLCSQCKEHCISEFDEAIRVDNKPVYYNGELVKGKQDERVIGNSTQISS